MAIGGMQRIRTRPRRRRGDKNLTFRRPRLRPGSSAFALPPSLYELRRTTKTRYGGQVRFVRRRQADVTSMPHAGSFRARGLDGRVANMQGSPPLLRSLL
jgi:hypothetical protein